MGDRREAGAGEWPDRRRRREADRQARWASDSPSRGAGVSPAIDWAGQRPTPRLRPPPFPLVDRPRPVVFQQPRQRPIGQELAARLTARTIIALVLGIDDPLNRRPAHETWLSEPAMHGHLRPKGSDF